MLKTCQLREAQSRALGLGGGRRRHAFIIGSVRELGGDGEHVAFSVPWTAEAGVGHGRFPGVIARRENEDISWPAGVARVCWCEKSCRFCLARLPGCDHQCVEDARERGEAEPAGSRVATERSAPRMPSRLLRQ
jgi:hypothetical protein